MRILSTRGAGPCVLFLHGSPSSPDAFDGLVAALAGRHRVLVGALPGYAGTPPLSPYDFEPVHAGIEAALLAETREPVALVGFSAGAYHALSLALRGQVSVRAVACLGGLAGVPDELRDAQRSSAKAVRAGLVTVETFAARMLSPGYLATRPEALETMRSWIAATTLDVIADEIEAFAQAPSLLSALGELDLPILARVGELDVAAPPALSRAIANRARAATLEVVPGAGHALLVEDGEATSRAVVRFLG